MKMTLSSKKKRVSDVEISDVYSIMPLVRASKKKPKKGSMTEALVRLSNEAKRELERMQRNGRVERLSLRRHSGIVRDELEHVKRVLKSWKTQLYRTRTLYRARDGKLWGIGHYMEGEMTPGWFIEYGAKTEHNPLGEMYPQGWQQIEDERGGCSWLSNTQQELMTLEWLEAVVVVPVELNTWVRVERVK